MLNFKGWIKGVFDEGSNPGAKTGLYPLGYGGVGLYPPQWYPTRSADAIFYMSIDERIFKNKDGGSFDITHIPGPKERSLNSGEGGTWDISAIKGGPSHSSGKDYAAKSGDGDIWSIKHLKGGGRLTTGEYVPAKGEGGMWNIKGIRECEKNESAGTFAIVGCEDSPNYQVWGARSDLKCKRKNKMPTMKFSSWVAKKENEKNG